MPNRSKDSDFPVEKIDNDYVCTDYIHLYFPPMRLGLVILRRFLLVGVSPGDANENIT